MGSFRGGGLSWDQTISAVVLVGPEPCHLWNNQSFPKYLMLTTFSFSWAHLFEALELAGAHSIYGPKLDWCFGGLECW